MPLTDDAKQRLERVAVAILEEPKRVHMAQFSFNETDRWAYSMATPACGTIACIAGWVVALGLKEPMELLSIPQSEIAKRSSELLDIDIHTEDRIYFSPNWPERFNQRLFNAPQQSKEYAQVVADYIRYVIAQDGCLDGVDNTEYGVPPKSTEVDDGDDFEEYDDAPDYDY